VDRAAIAPWACIDRWAPWGLAAWMAVALLDTQGPVGRPWPDWYDVPGLLLMLVLIARRADQVWMRPAAYLVLGIFFWLIARTPHIAGNTQAGHLLLAALAALTGMIVPARAARSFQAALLIGGALAITLTLACEAAGVGEWLSSHWNVEPQLAGSWRRWAGPTAHPNLLAYLCAVTLWAGLSWRWRTRRRAYAAAWLLGMGLGLCLFCTLSRTGWIVGLAVLLCGGAWRVWSARRTIRRTAPALVLAGAALASFCGACTARPDLLAARYASVQRQISPTPDALRAEPEANIVSRGNVYRDALRLSMEAPWAGHGLAAYELLGAYESLHAHQLALELLICGGIPALAGVLGGLLWLCCRGRGVFSCGLLALGFVSGLADNVFFFKWPALWLAFAAGCAAHARARRAAPVAGALAARNGHLLLVFVALAFVFQLREDFSIDFHAYYGAMRWNAETGEPPYQAWDGAVFQSNDDRLTTYLKRHQTELMDSRALQFLYPPTAFFQLRAFTWMEDPAVAARCWRVFNLAALGGLVALAMRFRARRAPPQTALLLCLLIGSYDPVRDTFWLGQVSVWVSMLILLYFWALQERRAPLAGVALALAAGLKIYPAFWLIIVLMFPGQRARAIAWFAAALGAMALLSVAVDGAEMWRSYWTNVISKMGDKPPPGGVTLYPFFGGPAVPESLPWRLWANRATLLTVISACAACLWMAQGAAPSRKLRVMLAVSAALLLSLPLVWGHYLVLLGVLLAVETLRWAGGGYRRAPLGTTVIIAAFIATGQLWPLEAALGPLPPWCVRAGMALAAAAPLIFALEARARRAVASPSGLAMMPWRHAPQGAGKRYEHPRSFRSRAKRKRLGLADQRRGPAHPANQRPALPEQDGFAHA
jgi:alpha-1,2-mannosyltransferase